MITSITLHLLFTPLVLGQDTVPDPLKEKGAKIPPPKKDDKPLDGYYPSKPIDDKEKDKDDKRLEEALGTSMPQSVKTALDQLRALHLGGRLWFYLRDEGDSHGDSICIVGVDGKKRIIRLAPFPYDLRIYEYDYEKGSWREIGTRTQDPKNPYPLDPQVSDGIKLILASRKEREWISPTIKEILKAHNIDVIQLDDGTLIHNGKDSDSHGDTIYVLKDGRVLILAPYENDPRVFIYSKDKAIQVTERKGDTHPDLEIQEGIRFILKSRKDRAWKAPSSKLLESIGAKYLGDGTWAYYGCNKDYHGDSVYILPSGEILALSKKPKDRRIWILKKIEGGKEKWECIGERTENPDDPYPDPEISKGIKAILDSRKRRGWVSPRVAELKAEIAQWEKILADELEAARITSVPPRSKEERMAIYKMAKERTEPYLKRLKEELASWED